VAACPPAPLHGGDAKLLLRRLLLPANGGEFISKTPRIFCAVAYIGAVPPVVNLPFPDRR
jgi:hypothetical protein